MIIISDNNLIFHIAILCFNIFFISSCITHIVFVLNFHYKLPVISFFLGGGGGGGGGGCSPGWMDIPICTSELNRYNLRLKSLTFPICQTISIKGIFLKSGYRIEIVSKIKIQIIWKNCILDMINFDFDWLTSLIKDYKPTPIPMLTIANNTCSPRSRPRFDTMLFTFYSCCSHSIHVSSHSIHVIHILFMLPVP